MNRETTEGLSPELRDVLDQLLQEIESLDECIAEYDRRIEQIAKEVYPEVALLKQVKGVGTLIAFCEDCAKEEEPEWKKKSARLQGQFGKRSAPQGELSLTRLKNQAKARAPVFDWAIGWLAREDQIVIPAEKRSLRIRTQRRRKLY
jgi:transposase